MPVERLCGKCWKPLRPEENQCPHCGDVLPKKEAKELIRIERGENVMGYEIEGQCPLCSNNRKMTNITKSVLCDGKSFTFQFWIYRCDRHGYWFYRKREGKHTLLDLAKHQRLAKIEPLSAGSWSESWDDFKIIEVPECPVCGDKWEQRKAEWENKDIRIFCRNCGSEIQHP